MEEQLSEEEPSAGQPTPMVPAVLAVPFLLLLQGNLRWLGLCLHMEKEQKSESTDGARGRSASLPQSQGNPSASGVIKTERRLMRFAVTPAPDRKAFELFVD